MSTTKVVNSLFIYEPYFEGTVKIYRCSGTDASTLVGNHFQDTSKQLRVSLRPT